MKNVPNCIIRQILCIQVLQLLSSALTVTNALVRKNLNAILFIGCVGEWPGERVMYALATSMRVYSQLLEPNTCKSFILLVRDVASGQGYRL